MKEPGEAGIIIWDFDGTLGYRDGMWSGCLLEVLDKWRPDHGLTLDRIRSHLHEGFPWHTPDVPHPHLSHPDCWWSNLEQTFSRVFGRLGIQAADAAELAAEIRPRFLAAGSWNVFDDVTAALQLLSAEGWRHIVLSNHVPELPVIMRDLGLAHHFAAVLSSASIGYEKPHPGAFHHALAVAGSPRQAWMVGDNVKADVLGAQAVGIRAVLVRSADPRAPLQSPDLLGAAHLILRQTPQPG
jgi:putative hydrolase of the HAD superfamily